MSFDPDVHHRRTIRLQGFDYASSGAYFVTICCKRRERLLGEIVGGEMMLNDAGRIVENVWAQLPEHYSNVILDEMVVMPNHLHDIIWLTDGVSAENADGPMAAVGTGLRPVLLPGTAYDFGGTGQFRAQNTKC